MKVVDDEDSFADYVHDSGPRLKRLAFLLTGDLSEAEDLLQSAYIKVMPRWEKVRRYDIPDAYLRRVMISIRSSWWRRMQGREKLVADVPESQPRTGAPDLSDSVVQQQALLQALRALPDRQRTAVVLRHWCDLSEAETADSMGCSLGTVKSNTSKGLAQLRTVLAGSSLVPMKGGRS